MENEDRRPDVLECSVCGDLFEDDLLMPTPCHVCALCNGCASTMFFTCLCGEQDYSSEDTEDSDREQDYPPEYRIPCGKGEVPPALQAQRGSISALHHGMINDDPIDVVLPARTDETTGNVNKVNEHDESLPTNRKNFPSHPGCVRKRSDRSSTTSHSDLSTEGTEPRQSCEGQEAPPWTDLEKRAHEGSRKLSCQGAQRDFPSRTGRTQTEDGPGCARKRSDDLRRRYSKSPKAADSYGLADLLRYPARQGTGSPASGFE